MGVLASLAIAAIAAGGLAACYSPAVRDCTVSCGSPDDCAAGQVCGSDGKCAAPEVAGRCAAITPDAAVDDPGGANRDAGLPRDAAGDASPPDDRPRLRLAILIAGRGSVEVEGCGTCSTRDPERGSCAFDVVLGAPLIVRAMPIESGHSFAMWTSLTCAGQGPRCVFTPLFPTTVSARFVRTTVQSTAP